MYDNYLTAFLGKSAKVHWFWNVVAKLCIACWSTHSKALFLYIVSNESIALDILEWRMKIQFQDYMLSLTMLELLLTDNRSMYALCSTYTCILIKICVKQYLILSLLYLCSSCDSHLPFFCKQVKSSCIILVHSCVK